MSEAADMTSVLLQLERLRRHYDAAVHTYDEVALLDLAHILRVWTELKRPLLQLSPSFSTTQCFLTAIPARKVLAAARGHRFVFSYMPGGAITYASNGALASGPQMGPHDKCTVGIAVKAMPGYLELGKYCYVSAVFDQSLVKALEAESVTPCTYMQWLGAEAVRLSYPTRIGKLKAVSISREMMVKRVANTLDGSHPSAAAAGDIDNAFDEPIGHLLEYKMGGLPLPYFILLKVAQDILGVASKELVDATYARKAELPVVGSGGLAVLPQELRRSISLPEGTIEFEYQSSTAFRRVSAAEVLIEVASDHCFLQVERTANRALRFLYSSPAMGSRVAEIPLEGLPDFERAYMACTWTASEMHSYCGPRLPEAGLLSALGR